MAIKKSDLYASLWASCDELRGGMDASQYKDDVLFMLFIKYISDKCANSIDFAPSVGDSVILRLTEGDPAFFGYLLNTPAVARKKASLGQGDAVVHIRAAALGGIEVLVPPDGEEQTAVATVLSDMDAELADLSARLAKTRAIKQGMMQELLTGRTRLLDLEVTTA